MCRQLTGLRLRADRVQLATPASATPELGTFFGCDVEFGARVDEIVFPPRSRPRRRQRRSLLNELLVKYCEEALSPYRTAGRSSLPRERRECHGAAAAAWQSAQPSEIARRPRYKPANARAAAGGGGTDVLRVLRNLRPISPSAT